jgi:hypothetical protein
MLFRRLSFLLLVVLTVGCTRYSSRNQGPFKKPPPPYSAAIPGPAANHSPLTMPGATAAAPSPMSEDPRLVPPKPPEMPPSEVVAVPQPPRPPAVPNSGVVPAAAFVPPPRIQQPAPDPSQPPPKSRTPSGSHVQNVERLKQVHQLAADQWAKVTTFEAKLTRRESMNGKDAPTEEVLFQFRKEPFSVYMRGVGGAGLGREVLFVKGKYDNKMKILTCKDDGFSGLNVTKSPDDAQVKARSRNDIRDAGFGSRIANFKAALDKLEAGKVPADAVKALGPVKRPEYAHELEGVLFAQPDGGVREVYFDPKPDSPSYGFPVVSVWHDATGREVEYNCFANVRLPANLTDADFTPDRFGKKK